MNTKLYCIVFIIVLLTSNNISLNAQSFVFLENWQTSELSADQLSRYNRILNGSNEDNITKVGIGDVTSINDNRITLSILDSECENRVFKGKRVEFESINDFTWYGELEYDPTDSCACKYGYILLMSKQGEQFGQIRLEDEYYDIEDIGEEM